MHIQAALDLMYYNIYICKLERQYKLVERVWGGDVCEQKEKESHGRFDLSILCICIEFSNNKYITIKKTVKIIKDF